MTSDKPFKTLEFRGDARKVIVDWPDQARQKAGFELHLVQQGKEPAD